MLPAIGVIFSSGILQLAGLVLFSLPQLILGGVLWKYSAWLAAVVTRDGVPHIEEESVSSIVATRIAIAALGFWVLSSAVPELLSQLYTL